jgi:hypothetical protein
MTELTGGTRLVDIAQVIRSKNAGPLQVTLDILFGRREDYERALASPAMALAAMAQRYGVKEGQIAIVPYSAACAIKIVLDRPIVAGSPGDSDVYGAQQHYPLLDMIL